MNKIEFFSTQDYQKRIELSSMNPRCAAQRNHVYETVMGNLEAVREQAQKVRSFFSSQSDSMPTQAGVSLATASIKAYINSIAGYVAIERPMTQPTELLTYKDIITKAGAKVMPFLGKQEARKMSQQDMKMAVGDVEKADFDINLNSALIPTKLVIDAIKPDNSTIKITDDGNGNLIAPAGILTVGTVNYTTGAIKLTFATALPALSNLVIGFAEDALDPNDAAKGRRLKPRYGNFLITATPNVYDFEVDVVQAAIAARTLGDDVLADMKTTVYDEHQISINDSLVKTLVDGYTGNSLKIDLSKFSVEAGKFSSLLKVFGAGLVSCDSAMAKRTYKAVAATAYVVGMSIADIFQNMDATAGWVPNATGYVNDVIGFYKGRAVIQNADLPANDGYAIHKTADGNMAPLGLGIFLPATDLPLTGNFDNITEVAGGIYSMDGTNLITSDLVQKFNVLMPSDWMQLS